MEKVFFAAIAVLIAYFLYLPVDREYIDFDGKRHTVTSIYSSPLYEPLTTRTDDFFNQCLSVRADSENMPTMMCRAAMGTASFKWPEIVDDPDCEIIRPGARLKTYGIDGRYLPLEEFFDQLPCDPEYLGTMPILKQETLEENGLFVSAQVALFAPHEAGDFHIYRYSSGLNTRYAAAIDTMAGRKLVELTMVYADKREEEEANPVRVSVGDPRFTDALIALGRANARDCGEFVLYSNGIAQCADTKWKISGQSATRAF